MIKEIGGYIEFEHYNGSLYHEDAIKLNCSRNCLEYLIKLHKITKIYIPFFLCDSVYSVCKRNNVSVEFYHINDELSPLIPDADFSKDWLYVVNYYGQLSDEKIKEFSNTVPNLIVDNVQSFFQMPVKNIPTIYNCRKFFGVADGAYLYSQEKLTHKLEKDISYKRMEFLFGRFEKSANEFYSEYVNNNKLFLTEPLKVMSSLTENILRSLDYKQIESIRTDNFAFLHEYFKDKNKLNVSLPKGAFSYPLYVENGSEIRKKLQDERIYIPTLWPYVFDVCSENDLEYDFAKNILPLPVDQRYGIDEIKYIINRIC